MTLWSDSSPAVVDLTVFSSVPDEFRRKDEPSAWTRVNRRGEPGGSFLEGPVFDDDGNLYVTDIEFGRVFRIDPSGSWALVTQWGGEPNGMAFLSPNELLVADYRNGLQVIDVRTGLMSSFLDRRNTERFKGVNDLVFDGAGNLFFTDQGQTGLHDPTGRVYRLGIDGHLDAILSNVPSPNGIALTPDDRVLFVAATRDNSIWRVPLMEDGGVSKAGRFFSTNGPAGPDGLAMDVDSRLVVANPGLGIVWVLDDVARPSVVLRSPSGPLVTNVAYGGADRKTLYCTESATGTVLRADLDVPGQPLHVPGRW